MQELTRIKTEGLTPSDVLCSIFVLLGFERGKTEWNTQTHEFVAIEIPTEAIKNEKHLEWLTRKQKSLKP